MKAKIKTQALQDSLKIINSAIVKRKEGDLLKLQAENNKLRLLYFTHDSAMFIGIDVEDIEDGKVICDMKHFSGIIGSIKDSELILSSSEKKLSITSGNTKINIPIMPESIDMFEEEIVEEFSLPTAIPIIERASSFNNSKVVISDGHVISTDGRIFCSYKSSLPMNGAIEKSNIGQIRRISNDIKGIYETSNKYVFKIPNGTFMVRKSTVEKQMSSIHAKLLEVEKNDCTAIVSLSKSKLLNILTTSLYISDNANIDISANKLTLSVEGNGSYSGGMEIENQVPTPLTFACNSRHLESILKDIEKDGIEIKTGEKTKIPIVIREKDNTDNLYVTSKVVV